MECSQCSHTQLRRNAKFCVYCGFNLGSICPFCNTRHRYGKKICDRCDHIIFSLFDHDSVESPDAGDNERVYITINNIKISVVWQQLITDIQTYKNKSKTRKTEEQLPKSKSFSLADSVDYITDGTRTDTPTDNTYTDDVMSDEEEEDVFALDHTKSFTTQRQHIINEIITTERDFLNDLDYMIEVFVNGLRDEKYITSTEITSIFSNVEKIREVNFLLFRYLQNADDCPSVPHAFMQTVDKMKIYGTYCSNLEKAVETVAQISKTKPMFATFLMNCKNRKDSRNLDLNSWLIKPLQRLCKYPLLLKQLQQATQATDPDFSVLTSAYRKVEELVGNVNSFKKDAESKKKAAELSQRLEGAEALHLMEPGRYFIQEGPVYLYPKDKGHYHLFSDLLVISKKKKVEDSISLEWCCIREKVITNKPVLEISHIGVRTWNFVFENEAEKIMFVKSVSELIDKCMLKAYNRYDELADDSHPKMEFSAWREERENIPTKSASEKRLSGAKRLSGLFKLGT